MSDNLPPLSEKQFKQLRADAADLYATAARKGVSFDSWDHMREAPAAIDHFELGCWLFYYSTLIQKPGKKNLSYRVDCARRIFEAGFTRLGYEFFTLFDFGERQFDSMFEQGDSSDLIDGLRLVLAQRPNPNLADAFAYNAWPKSRNLEFAF